MTGTAAALAAFGFTKTADPSDEPEDHRVRNGAVAAAAAAPFAGMIGQSKVLHDPHRDPSIKRFRSMEELSRHARPGDVLMTSKPGGSVWKSFIKPSSGSEFYHAQPVIGRRGQHATTLTAGQYSDPEFKGMSNKALKGRLETIPEMSRLQEYPDVMILRPKKPMTAQQIAQYTDQSLARGRHRYDSGKAVSTWLHDMFVPKIPGLERMKNAPTCEGNVCSTLPAQAYHSAGVMVAKGKRSQDIFPGDFLRSKDFEAVGARVKSRYGTSAGMRNAMPMIARGTLGAGLAGSIYAASENPSLAAVPLGAAAGTALAHHLADRRGEKMPGLFGLMDEVSHAGPKLKSRLLRQFATKKLPWMAAGGAGAYGASRLFLNRRAARTDAAESAGEPAA